MKTLTFLGDVWPAQAFRCEAAFSGGLILNLESPITRADTPAPDKICLKAEANHLRSIFGDNLLAAGLANNHIMDYGAAGLDETLRELERTGIRSFGAGSLSQNCNQPLILDLDGTKVGLLGYVCPSTHPIFATQSAPGVKPIHLAAVRADIDSLKRQAVSRVAVSLHWGMEEVPLPRVEDMRMARAIVDAGADLIIGHHSHCIQRYETYNGRPIFYGLGNCIFPDVFFPFKGRPAGEAAWKKQRSWNRQSLAVTWDVESGQTTLDGLAFADGCLSRNGLRPKPLRAELGEQSLRGYQRSFARHVRMAALRLAGSRFLERPTLPRITHLKLLLGRPAR